MNRKNTPQPQDSLNHWAQSMQEHITAQRQHLQAALPEQIAKRSGADWVPTGPDSGQLTLNYFRSTLVIEVPGYSVSTPQGETVPTIIEGLVITYFEVATGAPRVGEWITFRDLPGGTFYHQAFTGYSGNRLAQHFGNNLEAFKRGAEVAGGLILPGLGEMAYEFQILPCIWLAVVYWLGDPVDDFPSQANVLFDRSSSQYMALDGLAILGSQLVSQIIRASE